MRVLVVDDDQTILDLVGQILGLSAQHDVTVAQSAAAALAAIEEADEDFDCFLVDIQMPEVDGIRLVKLIRQTPGHQDVPIIMLTAMQDRHHLAKAFGVGATDYISKPFDFQDLRTRLPAAQKLAVEKARQRIRPPVVSEMNGTGTKHKDFGLEDPIPLGTLDCAIDYGEFENYVRQLTRRRLSGGVVFAVKICSVDKVYERRSSDDFRTLVRCAAEAVQDALLRNRGAFSYRGNGVFLCIPEARLGNSWAVLQTAVNDRFNAIQAPPGRFPVQLMIGDQKRFKSVSIVNVLETLSAAVESAEATSMELGAPPGMPSRLLAHFGLTSEERHLEKRAYEALLHNALSETTHEDWGSRLERRQKIAGGT